MAPDQDHIEIPLIVAPNGDGSRLDRYLSSTFGRLSRHRIHQMIASHRVRCAKSGVALTKKSMRVHLGQSIVVWRPAPIEPPVVREYEVVYQDDSILALNKPGGLPVHPSARYVRNTLTAKMSEQLGPDHGWEMAHRLDRETSGVMLFGRQGSSATQLKRAFFRRKITKHYLALVHGEMKEPRWIDLPLGPAVMSKIRIKVGPRPLDDGGQVAQTFVVPHREYRFRGRIITLVSAFPKTGRTHQIRAHLAAVGHGVLGDKLYGLEERRFLEVVEEGRPVEELEAELGISRHALHAYRIQFSHPNNDKTMCIRAPWPHELGELIALPKQVDASFEEFFRR